MATTRVMLDILVLDRLVASVPRAGVSVFKLDDGLAVHMAAPRLNLTLWGIPMKDVIDAIESGEAIVLNDPELGEVRINGLMGLEVSTRVFTVKDEIAKLSAPKTKLQAHREDKPMRPSGTSEALNYVLPSPSAEKVCPHCGPNELCSC